MFATKAFSPQSTVASATGRVLLRSASRFSSTTAASGGGSRARVLVVGGGRMGNIRASLIQSNPRFEFCGIVDVNGGGGKTLAEKYNVQSFTSLGEAIELSSAAAPLDGLIVSTPTNTHEDIIDEAADRGISVFTEKPVDETAEKIRGLFERAEDAGIALCCSFQRRFDPSYVAATHSVFEGQIGRPIMANIFFGDHPCPPREFLLNGGNIFMDLLAHDVDYITHTLQDDVVSVYASGTSSDDELAAAGVHDNATVVMNFSRGAVVTLFMSRSAVYGYDQRCEIFGDQGLVSVKNVHSNAAVLSNARGVHQPKLQHSFPQRFNEAFGMELNFFADTLLEGTPWPVTGEQCIKVQRVADAAIVSSETGLVTPVEPYVVGGSTGDVNAVNSVV